MRVAILPILSLLATITNTIPVLCGVNKRNCSLAPSLPSLWEGVPIYRTSYNNSFWRRIFHFGRVCQYTEQDTITAFQRIFHFGRVCQYTEQATITGGEYFTLGGCASENISLWEGVPIYRTSYNNSFGRRIFHFGRVCQYTEQDTITAANIQNKIQ